jgi:hypothetical protein
MRSALMLQQMGLNSPEQPTRWSSEGQATESPHYGTMAAVGLGAVGFHLAGRGAKILGKQGYDYVVPWIRSLEEYSPGGIFRTFQLSNFFSQFTTEAQPTRFFDPEYFISNSARRRYWSTVIGGGHATAMKLMNYGVEYRQGALYWGQTNEIALRHAGFILNTPITEHSRIAARYSAAYARGLGIHDRAGGAWQLSNLEKYFATAEPGERWGRQLIGGQTRRQHIWRQTAAWGGEMVSRFNRLLQMPFELPPGRQVFGAIQNFLTKRTGGLINLRHGLGVQTGSGLQVLGRLVGKWGILAPLGYLAWQEVDRITRNVIPSELPLGEGTNVAIAGTWARGQLLASSVAEATGLHGYREWQEEIAPGSTSIAKLAALPVAGALAGATAMYAQRVAKVRGLVKSGFPLEIAGDIVRSGTGIKPGGLLDKVGDLLSKISPRLRPKTAMGTAAAIGAAAGLALVAPFVPGALVPSDRPEELRDLYAGRQMVPVRKGRWWEMGSSDWEGGRIQYWRPHWFHRLRTRATDYALWGEDADSMSEFEKWWKKEFTYELEERHYWDRPYPITSVPFEDVPLVGPILAGTIGRLLKPPVMMHEEEYTQLGLGGTEYQAMPLGFGQTYNEELGELPEGTPISPYSAKGIIGEQIYRLTEMVGLPGFISTAFKESLTGSQDWFDEERQLESARRMHGMERAYWDEEIGGALGLTEWFRRLYPHRRRQIPTYNPIRNLMPGWLPGAADRSENFLIGDPYSRIPLGELRLPGPGYARLYPELEGVSPADYPLVHQFKILADVAPYSEAFKKVKREISKVRREGDLSDEEERTYQAALMQMRAVKKSRKTFYEYNYLKPYGDISDGSSLEAQVLTAMNEASKQGRQKGMVASLFGGYWEWLSHTSETALEQLTPMSPVGKFMHVRDPVEEYERTVLYGRDMRLWQNPIEHFVKPFGRTTAHAMGWSGVPEPIQQSRSLEEYFDILKYIKARRLEQEARQSGQIEEANEYAKQARQTSFGVNPYTRNVGSIFKAMPRRERDYYEAFSGAQTEEHRARILEMIPDNLKGMYISQWQNKYVDAAQKALSQDLLDSETAQRVRADIQGIQSQRDNEGFPIDEALRQEFFQTRIPGESYAGWYRRTKLLPQRLKGRGLPSPDWVGYNASVDLDDVKLKVVQDMGENMHDYDLWPDRANRLKYKPFIGDDTIEPLGEQEYNEGDIRSRLDALFFTQGMKGSYFLNPTNTVDGQNRISIHARRTNFSKRRRALKRAYHGRE